MQVHLAILRFTLDIFYKLLYIPKYIYVDIFGCNDTKVF